MGRGKCNFKSLYEMDSCLYFNNANSQLKIIQIPKLITFSIVIMSLQTACYCRSCPLADLGIQDFVGLSSEFACNSQGQTATEDFFSNNEFLCAMFMRVQQGRVSSFCLQSTREYMPEVVLASVICDCQQGEQGRNRTPTGG